MLILGIETSCDETSAAVVRDGRQVLANVVWSQTAAHEPYGGVVPEIASRQHTLAITRVARQALAESGMAAGNLDAIAATHGPGLAGALLVGLTFGRSFAWGLGIPFIPVNHLEGHIHSVWLSDQSQSEPPPLPALVLIVSGGHTELVLMRDHGMYQEIGRTRDDAAGEAFDKVGRLLGLPYPGGPSIQDASTRATDPTPFPRAWMAGTHDFSFSGLKTAVLHATYETGSGKSAHSVQGTPFPRAEIASLLSPEQVANFAAGFQDSVVDVLVTKTLEAAAALVPRSIAVVGGVAANGALRERMGECVSVPLFISQPKYSTDNAAMIAAAAYYVPQSDNEIDVAPALSLEAL